MQHTQSHPPKASILTDRSCSACRPAPTLEGPGLRSACQQETLTEKTHFPERAGPVAMAGWALKLHLSRAGSLAHTLGRELAGTCPTSHTALPAGVLAPARGIDPGPGPVARGVRGQAHTLHRILYTPDKMRPCLRPSIAVISGYFKNLAFSFFLFFLHSALRTGQI